MADTGTSDAVPTQLIFVGTGVSTAIPLMGHVGPGCACYDAVHTPNSKNKRSNVSILLHRPRGNVIVQQAKEREQQQDTEKADRGTVDDEKAGNEATTTKPFDAPYTAEDEALYHSPTPPPSQSTALAHWVLARLRRDSNVLIDAGKTLREAYFASLVKHSVAALNALILTHDHADAVGGLDDLRDLAPSCWGANGSDCVVLYTPPTYLTAHTLDSLASKVGYIINNSRLLNVTTAPKGGVTNSAAGKDNAPLTTEHGITFAPAPSTAASFGALQHSHPTSLPLVSPRRVTSLDTVVLPTKQARVFHVPSLAFPVLSIPVLHGHGYISLGFGFGSDLVVQEGHPLSVEDRIASRRKEQEDRQQQEQKQSDADAGAFFPSTAPARTVLYISDVSEITESIMNSTLKCIPHIDLLIVDMLNGPRKYHFSHFCADQVFALAEELQPRVVLTIGMYCELEHESGNKMLAELLESAHGGRLPRAEGVQIVVPDNDTKVPPVPVSAQPGYREKEEREYPPWLQGVERIEMAYDGMVLNVA